MDRADDPGVLSLQAYDSQAWQVHLRLRHIGINFRVFQINYAELKRLLQQISSSEQFDYVWNFVDTANLERVLLEITRLTHNLLASAKTLVDHTRHLVSDSYRDSEFIKEYQHEVGSRFATNNLSQFVEGLRNYALHYSLPFPRADMEYRTDPATGDATLTKRFVLEKSTLLKWDGWESKGKEYLAAAAAQIDLEKLLDDYHNEITSFHMWLHQRLQEIHATDLAWLNEIENRVKRAMARIDTEGASTTGAPQSGDRSQSPE